MVESSYQPVVRIFATTQRFDYACPWQSESPDKGTGSGVVIAPGKVLTGAHVVANATFLQVQKVSEPNKMVARVVAICHDCDLALLQIDDPHFMDGVEPATIGELPRLRDRVSVIGYPVGGEEISITEGVVSRIEVQRYSHSERQLLAVTVDAAINDGNSGGPVYREGKVVGIAFQALRDAENIGEMVPSNLIEKFLRGVEDNKRPEIPGLGIVTQNLENPDLRDKVGLGDRSGVLITAVEYGGSAWGILQAGDALLSIAGHRIANNATVRYAKRFRTTFDVVLGDHYIGDRIAIEVLRDGEVIKKDIELRTYTTLVPRSQYDHAPRYFICAGLVFQPLSLDFLRTWREWWDKAPPDLLHHYYSGISKPDRQEVIVLTEVLDDESNVGYEDLDTESIAAVNGQQPKNMAHFVELVEAASDHLELTTSEGCRIVLNPTRARDASERILDRYRISSDRFPT
ncbi:trypsin-like peptidase domain-containing protein [Desulfobulbus sp. AH-315-M07]|nr:trypsin-like peptidase domain-containing protein [Desulfobulbus sp. AH-315-M07]